MEPLLSIVIANYNYGRFLEGAIKSVIDQVGFEMCELIICDGASLDNSVEVIKKYEKYIFWWCSEKDKGQSDAFNKGFSHASGKYVTWLNADDMMVAGALNKIINFLERNPHVEWLSGGMLHCDMNMNVIDARFGAAPPAKFHSWLSMTAIGNPSTIFLKRRLLEVGGVDEDMHYIMDIDLWKKFFSIGMRIYHLNCYVWAFRVHELSKTALHVGDNVAPRHKKERQLYAKRYGLVDWKLKIGKKFWWIYKALFGAFLRSVIDTARFKGKGLVECFG